MTAVEEHDSLLTDVITAAELHHEVFPELVQFVHGIITEGFGIVAGPPKLGKSWWTLNLALAVAAGGRAFGKIPVQQRPVLLLALEDSERRLQARIRAVYGTGIPPHKLHLLTQVPPGLLIPVITAWLQTPPWRARHSGHAWQGAAAAPPRRRCIPGGLSSGGGVEERSRCFPRFRTARCSPHTESVFG